MLNEADSFEKLNIYFNVTYWYELFCRKSVRLGLKLPVSEIKRQKGDDSNVSFAIKTRRFLQLSIAIVVVLVISFELT